MVRLTKIYTRTGDKGQTSLGINQRLFKDSIRIEAIGEVDEANAFIGWAQQYSPEALTTLLSQIQNTLFDVGADLCVPEDKKDRKSLCITQNQVQYIERKIDEYNAHLPSLTSFVLPGGTKAASALHLARTVVRRAERRVVALQKESINPEIIKYLNRLSDLLFVLARYTNHLESGKGSKEILWIPGENQ